MINLKIKAGTLKISKIGRPQYYMPISKNDLSLSIMSERPNYHSLFKIDTKISKCRKSWKIFRAMPKNGATFWWISMSN